MKSRLKTRLAIVAGLCAALGGCALPSAAPVAPWPVQDEALFRHAGAQPGTAQPPAWWQLFADPELDALVRRAEQGNLQIEAAAARWAQARALVQQAAAQQRPQAGLGATASRQGGALVNAAGSSGTLLTLGTQLSYEADVFGRLRQATQAQALEARQREALLRSSRLLVQAEVAQTYLGLRGLDAQRALQRELLQSQRDSLALVEMRWRNGSVAEVEVLQARTEVAERAAQLAALDGTRTQLEHALALLLGETPSRFTLDGRPDAGANAAAALPEVPTGLPSQMLQRRPDLAAAQAHLQASRARAELARSAWLPSLTLTAAGGQASSELAELLRAGMRTWGLGLALQLPLLDGGRRQAGVAQADAEVQAELAAYRGQVLVAFREVEDQLVQLQTLAAQAQWQAQAAAASSRSVALLESRWRSGLASQLELLDARRSELRSRSELLRTHTARAQATVGLIKALGGGWQGG